MGFLDLLPDRANYVERLLRVRVLPGLAAGRIKA